MSGDSNILTGVSLVERPSSGGQDDKVTVKEDVAVPFAKTQQSNDTLKRNIDGHMKTLEWVFPPDSRFLVYWDACLLILLVFYAFILPYQIGVSGGIYLATNVGWLVVNILINAFFFVDTFLYLFRVYYNSRGIVVLNRKKIRRRYLTGLPNNLFLNLLASFPSTIIYSVVGRQLIQAAQENMDNLELIDTQTNYLLYLKVFDAFKLLRFSRTSSIMSHSSLARGLRRTTKSYVRRLLFFSCFLILVSHWSACIWAFTAQIQAGGLGPRLLTEPNWIGNWVNGTSTTLNPIGWYQDVDRYVLSLFWSLQTLTSIGYGNIAPYTPVEFWVACVLQLISGILWAYIIGSTVSIADSLNEREDVFRKLMDNANDLIGDFHHADDDDISTDASALEEEAKKSKPLGERIRFFLEEKHLRGATSQSMSSSSFMDAYPILQSLPMDLCAKACAHLCKRHLDSMSVLRNLVKRTPTTLERTYEYLAKEIVVYTFSREFSFHFRELKEDGPLLVKQGILFVKYENQRTSLFDKSVCRTSETAINDSFALLESGNRAQPRDIIVSCLTFSEMYAIPQESYLHAITIINPSIWKNTARWKYLHLCLRQWAYDQKK